MPISHPPTWRGWPNRSGTTWSTVVTGVGVPLGVKVAVFVVSLVAAIGGFVLTFRDYG